MHNLNPKSRLSELESSHYNFRSNRKKEKKKNKRRIKYYTTMRQKRSDALQTPYQQ